MLKLKDLRCNHERMPYGISGNPVFSWKLLSDEKDTVQAAYSVSVLKDGKTVAETGKVSSRQSIEVTVPGFVAEDRAEYEVVVRSWDNHGNEAGAQSRFEAAPKNFEAKWIEPANKGVKPEKKISMIGSQLFNMKPRKPADERLMPITLLRKEFPVKDGLKKARAYATAHGLYEISFNGVRPDQRFFAPEYTAYGSYVCYQTYDITGLLAVGDNACGVKLADGWYSGRIGMTGECGQYGLARALFLQIELYYEDGSREVICSDESFKWSDDGVSRYADIFIGAKEDNRYAQKEAGFDRPGFDDSTWQKPVIRDYANSRLHAQIGSPVELYQELPAVNIITTPKGEKIVDFGQVFAGIIRMTVEEKAGTTIKLEHTEVLDHKGNFINNIMGPNKEQIDYFVAAGTGKETFEPHFTFHGFRYVKVTGLENWNSACFTGLALTSTMDNAGTFKCSNPKINQLYHNVRWSQLSNMISIPTDCPQRERAGWTGDFEIFAPTAVYNQDMLAFTRRWLENMEADQLPDGQIPDMIPYSPSYKELMLSVYKSECSAAWGDASIIVPWYLYQTYGDSTVLARCYPMMERWFAYVQNEAETKVSDSFKKKKNPTERERENQKYLWNTGWHYGDWLTPSVSTSMMTFSKSGWMTREVIAPVYYANDALLMSRIAQLLGKEEDAGKYKALHERIKVAFQETCVDRDGRIDPDLQGMYVCAIWFDMVPEDMKVRMARRLVELIKANGYRLDTGFSSTPLLLEVLEKFGYADVAFKLLYQEECPSWLYEVKNGATTIWENWAAIKPNGKVDIFSYNHYAFGGVFNWIYRTVGGIDKAGIGFEKILVRPVTDPAMEWAETSHECVYGTIATRWERKKGSLKLDVTIPCNTSAEIILPDGTTQTVGSGQYSYTCKV